MLSIIIKNKKQSFFQDIDRLWKIN